MLIDKCKEFARVRDARRLAAYCAVIKRYDSPEPPDVQVMVEELLPALGLALADLETDVAAWQKIKRLSAEPLGTHPTAIKERREAYDALVLSSGGRLANLY